MRENFSVIHNKDGGYTIGNLYGFPLRVHDGYPNFKNLKEASWAAELAANAFENGRLAKTKEIRECLNIEDKSDD